jgi:hypothetical protein
MVIFIRSRVILIYAPHATFEIQKLEGALFSKLFSKSKRVAKRTGGITNNTNIIFSLACLCCCFVD